MKERVLKVIGRQFNQAPSAISMDTHLFNDLSLDSLDIVELTLSLESEFKVVIPDDVAENMQTVDDVVKYFEKLDFKPEVQA